MPLFEDSSERKLDSSQEKFADLSFLPENDFAELIWENGQVMMQGQSSRARKNPSVLGLPSYTPPFQSPKPSRDRGDTVASNIGGGNGIPSSNGKFGTFDNEFPAEMCDDDGDGDIGPWFSCPINDFLPELSGITVNENNFDAMKRNNKDYNLHSANDGQVPFPSLRAKGSETTGSGTTSTSNASRGDTSRLPNSNNFVNFSHFLRPKSLNRSIGWNNSVTPGSGSSGLERAGISSKREGSSANCTNTNPAEVKQTTGLKSVETSQTEQAPYSKNSEGIRPEDVPKLNGVPDGNGGASTSRDPQDAVEPVVASSVCSGNGLDGASDDPACNLKRKSRDTYDSEAPSEDVEEDSVGLRNAGPARGNGSKRGRDAEVHNLSERRRRDRINEKMRALQELIPNCNKVDKASMLDEAIEYLKTLQLQVQIMSMGAGMYMPPMMFPGGMQNMHSAHMAQFQAMGVGMASGLGFRMGIVVPNSGIGSSGFPMMQISSPMQEGHFPGPLVSGHPVMHGAVGPSYPVMGLPGQGHPMSMQRPPVIPFPGCSVLRPGMGMHSNGSIDGGAVAAPAPVSSSKEPVANNEGAVCSPNPTPSQCQARNGGFELSPSVQFSRTAGDDA